MSKKMAVFECGFTRSAFKEEFRDRFKKEVSEIVRSQRIPLPSGSHVWPATKFTDFRFRGTSLLECQPVQLEEGTWCKVLQNYMILSKKYNDAVSYTHLTLPTILRV